jgi:hypothetical protein
LRWRPITTAATGPEPAAFSAAALGAGACDPRVVNEEDRLALEGLGGVELGLAEGSGWDVRVGGAEQAFVALAGRADELAHDEAEGVLVVSAGVAGGGGGDDVEAVCPGPAG